MNGGKNMKDYKILRDKQNDANVAKERLMRIQNELEEAGFIRQANSLGTIIWKLEEWQNK